MENNIIYDDYKSGLTSFFNKIYAIMGLGILTSALVSYIMIQFFAANILILLSGNQFLLLIVFLIPVFIVGPIQSAAMQNKSSALPLFFFYSALMGFILSMTLVFYTFQSIVIAFVISASMFFALSVFGRTTKRDLSGIGKAMFAAVWGLIIASVINFFIGSAFIVYLISYASVVIFSILIAWNNQMIERVYQQNNGQVSDGWAISMALALYISFLNLFLSILRIVGGRD
ncbi:MAG: Bax inhibitor-1/YccA family protein [Lactovum sp.]